METSQCEDMEKSLGIWRHQCENMQTSQCENIIIIIIIGYFKCQALYNIQ